jgi:hypothetical protein
MRTQDRSSAADGIGLSVAFGATGGYFALVGLGVLSSPVGDDAAAQAPAAIIICTGAAFLFAGLVVAVCAVAIAREGECGLPADSSRWNYLVYRALAIAVAGAIAAIGTWIAISSGSRALTAAGPFLETRTVGEAVGRVIIGLGAVIVWIYVIALTVVTVRRLLDRRDG